MKLISLLYLLLIFGLLTILSVPGFAGNTDKIANEVGQVANAVARGNYKGAVYQAVPPMSIDNKYGGVNVNNNNVRLQQGVGTFGGQQLNISPNFVGQGRLYVDQKPQVTHTAGTRVNSKYFSGNVNLKRPSN